MEARYFRCPITDEQAPSVESFDRLIGMFEAEAASIAAKPPQPRMLTSSSSSSSTPSPPPTPKENSGFANSFFVFNCQMGRGRTTTGMILACLWYYHRFDHAVSFAAIEEANTVRKEEQKVQDAKDDANDVGGDDFGTPTPMGAGFGGMLPSLTLDYSGTDTDADMTDADTTHRRGSFASPFLGAMRKPSMVSSSQRDYEKKLEAHKTSCLAGDYKLILSLVRVLPDGIRLKYQVDFCFFIGFC